MSAQMTISLPVELMAPVRRAVADGEYGSCSEILREAIRDWHRKRAVQSLEVAGARKAERDAA
jgi:antitoxin ParD1/3/4